MATQKELEAMSFDDLAKLYKGKCREFKDLNEEISSIRSVLAHRQEVLQKEKELAELKARPIGAPALAPSAEKFSGAGKAVR